MEGGKVNLEGPFALLQVDDFFLRLKKLLNAALRSLWSVEELHPSTEPDFPDSRLYIYRRRRFVRKVTGAHSIERVME